MAIRIQQAAERRLTHNVQHFGFVRNFTLGAGMAWAISQEKYWHLPFIFFIPSPYAGYQAFKHRDAVREFVYASPSLPSATSATTSAGGGGPSLS